MDKKTKEALLKCVDGCKGKPFSELSDVVAKQESKEFPDFGGDVPEGHYFILGKWDVHDWTNRAGNKTEILTAFVANSEGKIFEVAFAAFCAREWDFVKRVGENDVVVEANYLLPFYPSLSKRTVAVKELEPFTEIVVKHERGHFANPYNTRVFNFNYTWVESA